MLLIGSIATGEITTSTAEDCLYLNVYTPSGRASARLLDGPPRSGRAGLTRDRCPGTIQYNLWRMSKNTPWIFVDCEARGTSPVHGVLAEFGAVHYDTRETFHGRLFDATPDPDNPAIPIVGERLASDTEVAERFAAWLKDHLGNKRPVFVSDNPAYDWQWIAGMFDRAGIDNPFGHSGRRISDFWAGLNRNWSDTQGWKRFRRTAHDHNPVHDAMGNVEAFDEIMRMVNNNTIAADAAE